MKTVKGFTLIELMIVVVVIGILVAIALPAYNSSVQKGKRADGKSKMISLANSLERCYTQYGAYNNANCVSGTQTSESGYYSVAINASTSTQFLLTATGQKGQENDTDCVTMTLNQANAKTPAACW